MLKRAISKLLVLTMLMSMMAGDFTFTAFADDPAPPATVDEFAWAFWSSQPQPAPENVETLNVTGRGSQFLLPRGRILAGTADHNAGENKSNILDGSTGTKWLANTAGDNWVVIDMDAPFTANTYYISSANDAQERDPGNWVLYGRNDEPTGQSATSLTGWTEIHRVTGHTFSARFATSNFTIPAAQRGEFRYYRLQITARRGGATSGMMQFSRIGFPDSEVWMGPDPSITFNFLYPYTAPAMTNHWAGPRRTMNGENVMHVNGNIVSGSGNADAKSYTTIRSGLNIQVHPDTLLGYMFAPEGVTNEVYTNTYDWKFHSHHMSVDLKFSDGTYLRNLGAIDQYGVGVNPKAQGEGKMNNTYQWNHVESQIGRVAAGKVITDILVGFEMDNATRGHKVAAWFDDIKIFRCPYGLDYSKVDPADFTDIRQGTNSQLNASGSLMPIVSYPNPHVMWIPSAGATNGALTDTHNYYQWGAPIFRGFFTSRLASRWMGEQMTLNIMANSSFNAAGGTNTTRGDLITNQGANFNHDNEFAYHNYHYGVTFNADDGHAPGVTMEITPTNYGAVMRFTFPAGSANRNITFDNPRNRSNGMSAISGSNTNPVFTGWIQNNDSNNGNGAGTTGRAFRRFDFYGQFSAQPTFNYTVTTPGSGTGSNVRSIASFPNLGNGPDGSTVIELRIAQSWISPEQAKKNFAMDIIGLDKDAPVPSGNFAIADGKWFDTIKTEAKGVWNETLGMVEINDPTANWWLLNDFYSKMARSFLYPTVLSEYTGRGLQDGWQYSSPYRGTHTARQVVDGYLIYNEGWWDTFKSKWPLLGFFAPEHTSLLTTGIIQHYVDQDGVATATNAAGVTSPVSAHANGHSVPRWINPAGNNMMTGTSSDAVIADMFSTYGVEFDLENGYTAFIKNASALTPHSQFGGRNGNQEHIFRGFTPHGSGDPAGGGSALDTTWGLENSVNDAAQSHMLRKLAADIKESGVAPWNSAHRETEEELAEYWAERLAGEALYYENRGKNFINHFNPARGGWMRNRRRTGVWHETDAAFNPLNWGMGYTEDNAWPYRFLAPQDGVGLANLFGSASTHGDGPRALGEALDDGFYAEGAAMQYNAGGYGGWIHEGIEKREVKMGQFGLSNQPAYHMPWMYLFSDRPWQTQYWTRISHGRAYSGGSIGYGYLGEEDNGAMASWLVWAMMGLYPLDLGEGSLVIGSPYFRNMTITNDRGKKITINAANNSQANVYIQSIRVNGEPYSKPYICEDLLSKDLVIDYVMGPEPNKTLFTTTPPSLTKGTDTPDYLRDLVPSNIAIIAGDIPEDQATPVIAVTNMAIAGNNRAAFMFDDTSGNAANRQSQGALNTQDAFFTERTGTITYFNPRAPKVEMYTLTSFGVASGTNSASGSGGVSNMISRSSFEGNPRSPKAWTFEGSQDGKEWTVLDSRSNEIFEWRLYTRPFAIAKDKQGNYRYYRFNFTDVNGAGNLALAQVEFLADQFAEINKDALAAAIEAAEAKLADDNTYVDYTVKALEEALEAAGEMMEAEAPTGRELDRMITRVNTAAAALIRIKDVGELNDATLFDDSSAAGREVTGGIPNTNGGAPNSWIAYRYIDFGDAEDSLFNEKVYLNYCADQASCNNGSSIEVRIGAPDGELIAVFNRNSNLRGGDPHPTGNWSTGSGWTNYRHIEADVLTQVNGVQHVYLVLRTGAGTPNQWVANIRNFSFSESEEFVRDTEEIAQAVAEAAKIDWRFYTTASWADFTSAFNAAQAAINNPFATQAALDFAMAALERAIDALDDRINMVDFAPVASAKQIKGNSYDLTITINEKFDNGATIAGPTAVFPVNNNFSTRFDLKGETYNENEYIVFVSAQGGNVREAYIVNYDQLKLGLIRDMRDPADGELVGAAATAIVDKFTGNQNQLSVRVTETYDNGAVVIFFETFLINNNSAGIFEVGPYNVFVSTSGNTTIRNIFIVADAEEPGEEPDVDLKEEDEEEDEEEEE